jgi:acyl-CoA thioesterase
MMTYRGAAMAVKELELRVAALEAEMKRLKATQNQPWWEKISGTFDDDPTYDEAMALGRAYRESQRPKTAKRRPKKQ